MIEALAHDLGKASQARFGDHAKASAELLRKVGFEDAAVLHLIECHHKNLFLERKALPKRISRITIPSIEGRQVWKGLKEEGIFKDKRFVGRVLEELETVNVLTMDGNKRYRLNMSLAPKHSYEEVRYKPVSDEKLKDAIIEMHSLGFSVDGIAYQAGLPELHVKLLEKVLSKTLRREVLNDGINR